MLGTAFSHLLGKPWGGEHDIYQTDRRVDITNTDQVFDFVKRIKMSLGLSTLMVRRTLL